MRRIPHALLLAALLTFAVAASPALAAGAIHQVTNAGNDPFAACTAGTAGINYPRSEVEPFGTVNPANPSNIVTVVQQDRWSNGGAHGLVAGVSSNGGSTWSVVPLPFSACAANAPAALQYERASDPWVSFGPGTAADPGHGATAYSVSISFNQSPGKNGNTVGAAVSSDGGATWQHAQSMHADAQSGGVPIPVPDSNFQFFHDKESVTADPTRPGTAYAVWDVLIGPNANIDSDIHSADFSDDTLFTRTTDFGATWSPVRVINTSAHPTTNKNQTIGNIIVVDPRTGTLYDFFNQIFNTGTNTGSAHGDNAAFQRSTDGGLTWSDAQVISTMNDIGVTDPNNVDPRTNDAGAPFRVGNGIPAPAIDPETGDLFVVWEDARFSGHDEVAITRSSDGGATWSAPKRASTPTGQPAFTPAAAVTDSGTPGVGGRVGVTYYQLGATSQGSSPTTYFIKSFGAAAVSSSDPASLDTGVAATTVFGPFNMLDAPFALGYFVGDYEAVETIGSGPSASFAPVFVAGACGTGLTCSALTSVVAPANRTATGNDSTDLFVGTGF